MQTTSALGTNFSKLTTSLRLHIYDAWRRTNVASTPLFCDTGYCYIGELVCKRGMHLEQIYYKLQTSQIYHAWRDSSYKHTDESHCYCNSSWLECKRRTHLEQIFVIYQPARRKMIRASLCVLHVPCYEGWSANYECSWNKFFVKCQPARLGGILSMFLMHSIYAFLYAVYYRSECNTFGTNFCIHYIVISATGQSAIDMN